MSNASSEPGSSPSKLHRPIYEVHSSSGPKVEVPKKKAYGIDADDGPYSKWRIYNEFRRITKDRSTWPDEHTLLQDWHIPQVIDNINGQTRKERYPADFDYCAHVRMHRLPRGRAAKEEFEDEEGNTVFRYLVYKQYYQLHGDEGAPYLTHHVKNKTEEGHGVSVRGGKAWFLGDVALAQTEFTPTENELKHGTDSSRYNIKVSELPHLAKDRNAPNKARPTNSSSRTPKAKTTARGNVTHTKKISKAGKHQNAGNSSTAAQESSLNSQDTTDEYDQVFSKLDLDQLGDEITGPNWTDQDPFELLGEPEIPETPQPPIEGLSSRDQFAANVSRHAKHTQDLKEARVEAIQAMALINEVWAKAAGGMIVTQEDEAAWLEAGMDRVQASMVEAMNTLNFHKMTEAYDEVSKMKEALRDRRRSKVMKLGGYLIRHGIKPEYFSRLVKYARTQYPLADYCSLHGAGFPDQPPPEKYFGIEADLLILLSALQEKKHLNSKVVLDMLSCVDQGRRPTRPARNATENQDATPTAVEDHSSVSGVPASSSGQTELQDEKGPESSSSVVNNDGKREAEPADDEQASPKRIRIGQANSTVIPSEEITSVEEDENIEDERVGNGDSGAEEEESLDDNADMMQI